MNGNGFSMGHERYKDADFCRTPFVTVLIPEYNDDGNYRAKEQCSYGRPILEVEGAVSIGIGHLVFSPSSLSAVLNRLSKNIGILPIVIPELKFRNVQGKVFPADLMIGANHAALHERPEAFDGVGVDRSDDVLPGAVVDSAMGQLLRQGAVRDEVVVRDEADLVRDRLGDEAHDGLVVRASDDTGDDVTLTLDGPNDRALALDAAPLVVAVMGTDRAGSCPYRRCRFHQPQRSRPAYGIPHWRARRGAGGTCTKRSDTSRIQACDRPEAR